MDSFLHMGGYAFYVWSSYALALLVLVLNWVLPKRALRAHWRTLLRRARPETAVKETSLKETSVKEATA